MPPGEPVPAVLRAAFDAARDTVFAQFRQPQPTLHTFEQ